MQAYTLMDELLGRAAYDWLDAWVKEQKDGDKLLRIVIGNAGWAYELAGSTHAMRTLAASEAGSREVAASATAMREVAAVENAVQEMVGTPEAIWGKAMAWGAISGSGMAVGKFVIGAAGLETAAYADMEAVAASSVAMEAVAASTAARQALWQSDTALLALQNSPDAVQCLIDSPYAVRGEATSSSKTFKEKGTRLILLRRWYSSTSEYDYLQWDRDGENLPGYGAKAVKYGEGYAGIGNGPDSNNSDANNVRACSGLRRNTWSTSSTLTVYYLPV
uniref:Tail fiber protein n=1 Tax=Myoviridae sp. ctGRa7 TaxID=2826633 RepID=A0A8S5MZY8_9CAUD|nr:MAG TPA: Tail fiber protein [Myoviridae sp. ctGRa7]